MTETKIFFDRDFENGNRHILVTRNVLLPEKIRYQADIMFLKSENSAKIRLKRNGELKNVLFADTIAEAIYIGRAFVELS